MSVIWNTAYATQSLPMTHARILYLNRAGTVTASSEVEGFEAVRAAQPDTYSFWQPAVTPATWEVDFGSPFTVDAVAIGAHGLAGQTVAVETWTGSSWVSQVVATAIDDAGAVMLLFAPVVTQKVRLTVAGVPAPVGVIYVGQALVMAQKAFAGLGQINLKRRTEFKTNQSEGGQWVGRSIARVALGASYSWEHLTDAWYLANMEPFSLIAREAPFFLAARPQGYAAEVVYGWVAKDIQPERMGVRDLCSVALEITGHMRA